MGVLARGPAGAGHRGMPCPLLLFEAGVIVRRVSYSGREITNLLVEAGHERERRKSVGMPCRCEVNREYWSSIQLARQAEDVQGSLARRSTNRSNVRQGRQIEVL